MAKHTQCLVVAREVLFASREKQQKTVTRLEDQSILAAVDKATEEVHRATE